MAKLSLLSQAPLRLDAAGEIQLIAAEAPAAGEVAKPSRFSMIAYTGATVFVPQYKEPLTFDLAGITHKPSQPVLKEHDRTARVHPSPQTPEHEIVHLPIAICRGGWEP